MTRLKVAVAVCTACFSLSGQGKLPEQMSGGSVVEAQAKARSWHEVRREFLFAIGDAMESCTGRKHLCGFYSKSDLGLAILLRGDHPEWKEHAQKLTDLVMSGRIDEFD